MKQSWLGAVLLVLLLVAGLTVTERMAKIHDPIAASLTAAGEAALADDWEKAVFLCAGAERFWQDNRFFRACFADHEPMEEVEDSFAQLKIFLRTREATAFAATCADTAQKAKAMGDAHGLSWENFF